MAKDRREDAGQFYPGGSVIPRGPVTPGGGGTPSDYPTVRTNAATGAAHAALTGNPHGTTAAEIQYIGEKSVAVMLAELIAEIGRKIDGPIDETVSLRGKVPDGLAVKEFVEKIVSGLLKMSGADGTLISWNGTDLEYYGPKFRTSSDMEVGGDATANDVVTKDGKHRLSGKQDKIDDLAAIRSGAAAGSTALQAVPNLDASKITTGTLNTARIPSLAASKINSGTFAAARLPLATSTAKGAVMPVTKTDEMTQAVGMGTDGKLYTKAGGGGGGGGGLTGHTVTFSPTLGLAGVNTPWPDELHGSVVFIKSDGTYEKIEVIHNRAYQSLAGMGISDVVYMYLEGWYTDDTYHQYQYAGVNGYPPFELRSTSSEVLRTGYAIGVVVSDGNALTQMIPQLRDGTNNMVARDKAYIGVFSLAGGCGDINGYTFNGLAVTKDMTIRFILGHASCLLSGTLIRLADGTDKPVEDITYDDELLVWDFDNGCQATAKPAWIKVAERTDYAFINEYASGRRLRTTGRSATGWGHRHFDADRNEFRYTPTTVGDRVMTLDGEDEHVSCRKVFGDFRFYNLITERHFNCYADGVLTSCSLNNLYPVRGMRYVKDGRAVRGPEQFPDAGDLYGKLRLGEVDWSVDAVNEYVNSLKGRMA